MKTKLTFVFSFLLIFGISFSVNAQSDKDNYWILENFNDFEIQDDWIVESKDYSTYPNDVILTTQHASIEEGSDCAYGQNALRVRGAEEGGSVSFTVENASTVTFYFTGKQKASDRGVRIYRNNVLIKTHDGIDRYDCVEFTDPVNSETSLTYKIIGASDTRKDPFVLYYVEVQKYGKNIEKPEPPTPNYESYWIYEDFKSFPLEMDDLGDGIYNTTKNYLSLPNNIVLQADSANIELGEGCTGGNERKILRIRGKKYSGGSVEFTVPNAKTVSINITGKSTSLDRTVKIFKNDELMETFNNLDRSICEEYYEEANSSTPVTYRIEGGTDTEKPIGIKSIFIEKYEGTSLDNLNIQAYEVYPNPAQEIVYFKTETNKPVNKVLIYDTKGRLVLSQDNASQVNISSLIKGFYIVRLINENNTSSHKLIKN